MSPNEIWKGYNGFKPNHLKIKVIHWVVLINKAISATNISRTQSDSCEQLRWWGYTHGYSDTPKEMLAMKNHEKTSGLRNQKIGVGTISSIWCKHLPSFLIISINCEDYLEASQSPPCIITTFNNLSHVCVTSTSSRWVCQMNLGNELQKYKFPSQIRNQHATGKRNFQRLTAWSSIL